MERPRGRWYAGFEHDVGLDRGVAAGIENLAGDDIDDGAHACFRVWIRDCCASVRCQHCPHCSAGARFRGSACAYHGIELDQRLEQRRMRSSGHALGPSDSAFAGSG